ncbi:MAG TPA: hypothetical protein H9761_06375 [Candidatus Eisenbergiella merdavium]|uniref:Uncharacterized protein n=1 Tax=Candidatus Eisenbergiella merdavium TaxID=2838551 RepID=A0A9D2NDV1_9FIRM|nr:hypothetical protein [Candidatus Eisenbergiella merdavium]
MRIFLEKVHFFRFFLQGIAPAPNWPYNEKGGSAEDFSAAPVGRLCAAVIYEEERHYAQDSAGG